MSNHKHKCQNDHVWEHQDNLISSCASRAEFVEAHHCPTCGQPAPSYLDRDGAKVFAQYRPEGHSALLDLLIELTLGLTRPGDRKGERNG